MSCDNRRMHKLLSLIAFSVPFLLSGQVKTSRVPAAAKIKELAFDITRGDVTSLRDDIFVMEPLQSKPKRVVGGMDPVLSPDGERMAYCLPSKIGPGSFGIGQMHFVNVDGSGDKQATNLEGGACPCDWSTAGGLAFQSRNELYVMSADGNYGRKLTEGYGAHWSPDGKKLVFIRNAQTRGASNSIWIINADGTDARKVIDDNSDVVEANWGANADSILFTSTRERKKHSEIFRVNLDGSGLQLVANDKHFSLFFPVLSPDGRSLVVDGADSSEERILLLDLASHRTSVLAHGAHPSVLWTK